MKQKVTLKTSSAFLLVKRKDASVNFLDKQTSSCSFRVLALSSHAVQRDSNPGKARTHFQLKTNNKLVTLFTPNTEVKRLGIGLTSSMGLVQARHFSRMLVTSSGWRLGILHVTILWQWVDVQNWKKRERERERVVGRKKDDERKKREMEKRERGGKKKKGKHYSDSFRDLNKPVSSLKNCLTSGLVDEELTTVTGR